MALTPIENSKQLEEMRNEITRFLLSYKFGLDEITTKVNILQEEFRLTHETSPIEHVNTRVKSPQSIFKKLHRKKYPMTMDGIRENIRDIAGIRIVCSFVSDIYRVFDMITAQSDIEIIEVKDYIKEPKPNGYQSLHIIMRIPVFMSDRMEKVYVEMQIRTIAMDFWASLEHKIYYKYNQQVPQRLTDELYEASQTALALDNKMERLHEEVNSLKQHDDDDKLLSIGNMEEVMQSLMENVGVHTKNIK